MVAPELLAPAGDWEALRAAVAGGADAVYFGLSAFNARHRATNFSPDELPQVVDYLHRRNVRGYVALNTLIFSDELAEAARLVAIISAAGADAVIVQDLGLARLIHRLAPDLPIHGSTQMTLTEPRGIEFVRRLGVERVILARELSIDDIRKIVGRTDMPLEVFVHGALCIAYSGQCLTSEALGGRSANRGQCAQACRLPYELIVDGSVRELGEKAYLLSPQDLAAYDLIEPLVKLGVSCFKIEGRLKSPQYVAVASQTYRAAIDAAIGGPATGKFDLPHQQVVELQQSFSRGFSPGFLAGIDHQRLVEGRFPKSRGVRLGTVVRRSADRITIELAAEHAAVSEIETIIKPGDGVVFDEGHPEQDEQGGRIYSVVPLGDRRVELTFGRGQVNTAALSNKTIVWKTDDPALRRRTEQLAAREECVRRTPVKFQLSGKIGGTLELAARDSAGHEAAAVWLGPIEVARSQPFSPETARDQLGRLGDTPFSLGDVQIDVPAEAMVPKSVLNQLRREAVEKLVAARLENHRQPISSLQISAAIAELRGSSDATASIDTSAAPQLYVLVRTQEQFEAIINWRPEPLASRPALVYCDFEDVRRYTQAVGQAHAADQPIGLATLRVLKPGEEGLLARVAQAGADALLVRNLAALEYFQDRVPHTPWIGDFSLNVANELTAALFFEQRARRLVPSYDLNWDQLAAMLRHGDPSRFEVVIHQHMPMFHMEHCVFAALLSNGKDWRDCGRPCDSHQVALRDRVGAEFPLTADTGCRNTVFNSVAQSAAEFVPRMLGLGVRHFRVELLRESATEAIELIERYARVLAGIETPRNTWRQLQVLNQLGVTRGTLQHQG